MTVLSGDLHAASAWLLIAAVVVVGVLHTAVPDHWMPITLLARQHGWSRAETARAAARAGMGHVLSTLLVGIAAWMIGATAAQRFGTAIDAIASLALVLFGGWCVLMGVMELREEEANHHDNHDRDHQAHDHGHSHHEIRHAHRHQHEGRAAHAHMHAHAFATVHPITASMETDPPFHDHGHKATGRSALPIILGSSPMIEGIPAFFAASTLGIGLIVLMSILFAASTIGTYVALCVYSAEGLERVRLGLFERYGEILSGAFIALVGATFWIWPPL